MNRYGHQQSATITTIDNAPQSASSDFSALLKRLRAGIQKRDIRKREDRHDRCGRVHYIDLVEWHIVAALLDRLVPEWSYAVRGTAQIGEFAVITVAITINGVTRESIGTGPANCEHGIKQAENDALKRAAAKFGVARKLYRDEERFRDPEQYEDDDNQQIARTFDPLAKTAGDLISLKQLLLINTLAKQAKLDPEVLCRDMYRASLGEISRRAASVLIDQLQTLAPSITQ